jgi:hypothetical protein
MTQEGVEALKTTGDVAAGFTVLATLMAWLPPVAAGLTILWTAVRLYEWAEKRWGFGRGRENERQPPTG